MTRTAIFCALTTALMGMTGCAGEDPAEAPSAPTFSFRVVTRGLESPWEMVWGPDDLLWVTERTGKRIVRVDPENGSPSVAVEIPDAYQAVGQDGVLGMALHPELLQGTGNDYVYVASIYDADPGAGTRVRGRIQRYTWDAETETLGAMTEVISGLPAHDDHIAGRLAFGPDAKLYFSVGDQGSNWLQNRCNPNLAQMLPSAGEVASGDWSHYQGKILRINLDGSIANDNPVIDGVRSHVYSWGHRNPQGLVFDADGQLFEAEHGPSTDDEVNRIDAGGNYGWPQVAGYRDDRAYAFEDWAASAPAPCGDLPGGGPVPDSVPVTLETEWDHPDFKAPLETFFTVGDDYDFQANGSATIAASGLEIYTNANGIPGWADSLLVASLSRGAIYRISLSRDHTLAVGGPVQEFKSTNRYRDVAIRPDGRAIYIATDNTGRTRNDAGESTAELANPGAILEFSIEGNE